jgi:hypothetical protein
MINVQFILQGHCLASKLSVPERIFFFIFIGPVGITTIFTAAHHAYLFWTTGNRPPALTHHLSTVVTSFFSRCPKCFTSFVFFKLPFYTHFLSPAFMLRALFTSAFLTLLAQWCFLKLTNCEAAQHILHFKGGSHQKNNPLTSFWPPLTSPPQWFTLLTP